MPNSNSSHPSSGRSYSAHVASTPPLTHELRRVNGTQDPSKHNGQLYTEAQRKQILNKFAARRLQLTQPGATQTVRSGSRGRLRQNAL
jgi:hypothetical protein